MKRGFLIAVLMALCVAGPMLAQSEAPTHRSWKKAWIASAIGLVAATAFDAGSSAGRYESNPLLRRPDGTFNTRRALLFKGAGAGAVVLFEALRGRRHSEAYKTATIVNGALAGGFAAIAARNLGVPKASR